jgi:hypothetical protein
MEYFYQQTFSEASLFLHKNSDFVCVALCRTFSMFKKSKKSDFRL